MNYFNIKFLYICKLVMSWFAAKTKYKGEFKASDFFSSMGIKSYVPSYTTKKYGLIELKKLQYVQLVVMCFLSFQGLTIA